MFGVRERDQLSAAVTRLVIDAPRVAAAHRPGQFVIVRLGPGSERIPLTVARADPDAGTITLFVQAVGKSTRDLVAVPAGGLLHDVAGPLGQPTELLAAGHAVCVGGGVGTAVALPIATGLAATGVRVTSIVGARSADLVILQQELAAAGAVLVCTEDGSAGRRGLVTDLLAEVLATDPPNAVYAVGPVPMMRACAQLTRPYGVPTTVSVNSIMVDGTGMCGGCRVVVGGVNRYACVDGPEFDGHQVDFDVLADRLTTYREFERAALDGVGGPAYPPSAASAAASSGGAR